MPRGRRSTTDNTVNPAPKQRSSSINNQLGRIKNCKMEIDAYIVSCQLNESLPVSTYVYYNVHYRVWKKEMRKSSVTRKVILHPELL